MFLRGTGVATEDIRDKGQELYLQNLHKIDDESKAKGPREMPDDLLKFIQDVGPATQTVDESMTSPRLLEKENEQELNKMESVRKVRRERIKMPLMGEDDTFTTTRNTNFSNLSAQEESGKEFGLSNLQLYQLLLQKDTLEKEGSVDSFYDSIVSELDNPQWSEEEKAQQKKLLKDALAAIEIPVLRKDKEANFFGLYPKDVPGPEVKSIEPIPESKVRLVLQDLVEKGGKSESTAAAKLEQRRQLRKGSKPS